MGRRQWVCVLVTGDAELTEPPAALPETAARGPGPLMGALSSYSNGESGSQDRGLQGGKGTTHRCWAESRQRSLGGWRADVPTGRAGPPEGGRGAVRARGRDRNRPSVRSVWGGLGWTLDVASTLQVSSQEEKTPPSPPLHIHELLSCPLRRNEE